MPETERTIAPKKGRIAQAAREGLFAHSTALVPGAALLTGGLLLGMGGPDSIAYLLGFFEKGIANAAYGRDLPRTVSAAIPFDLGRLMFQTLLILFVVSAATGIGPALWARRHRGHTAVPLPKIPKPLMTLTLIRTLSGAVFLLLCLKILRDTSFEGDIQTSLVAGWLTLLCRVLQKIFLSGGAVLLLAALTEIVVLRTQILGALRLSPTESRREARATDGDPAVRSETRRRARRGGAR